MLGWGCRWWYCLLLMSLVVLAEEALTKERVDLPSLRSRAVRDASPRTMVIAPSQWSGRGAELVIVRRMMVADRSWLKGCWDQDAWYVGSMT